ncbi:MAG TPA: VOC family protein [Microvirga sp.]|jgi:predicted 3-demethylubiquinone-9 3-methyltransferase (glyoxalase superfamily)|nr:VOC family protein [Microvirga sp.]
MRKIIPHLWFADKAEEAARFYVSLLPNSSIDSVTTMPADSPSGPAGAVQIVEFTLMGEPFLALNAGPLDPFNHAVSFVIPCETQDEVDRLWDALSEGGTVERCGWLKDRYGLSWQIVPVALTDMMRDRDPVRGRRVAEAIMGMVKLEIAGLQRAYEGRAAA